MMHFKLIQILSFYGFFNLISSDKNTLDEVTQYDPFLNYGDRKLKKLNNDNFENSIFKSKIEVLGEIFKKNIDEIKEFDKLDVIFLIDSSSSVGENNFDSEIKFVKKLLSDITVDYNHTRIAVITYSSNNQVIRHIDEITFPNENNNKCLLLNEELRKVKFSGGGTYTLGAFKEAQEIFNNSRNNSKKILFLITDGFSNGGDPVPVANDLKDNDVIIFTIGIQNGNYKELFDLSSQPGQLHSYLLDSFQEFENLARRALHVDFKRGDYIPLRLTKLCDKLCVGGDCCDSKAVCTCGTSTGHYSCLCKPGYYGSGLKNGCSACPTGTYADGANLCIPCPDIQHFTVTPAIGLKSCKCKAGYRSTKDNKCEAIKCPTLSPPVNGYFVKNKQCSNVLNSACGVRCLVGYTLVGSSIRLCQSNATWSGYKPSCQIKTCDRLKPPQFGSISCKHTDLDKTYELEENMPVDTICVFSCDKGRTLIGSSQRTCLPLAQWDGLKTSCKQLKCNKVSKIPYGKIEPKSCTTGKQPYGKKCNVVCQDGFKIVGPKELECTGQHWNDKKEDISCIDVIPPTIECPSNIKENSLKGRDYGHVTWAEPIPKDNTNLNITFWMKPSIKKINQFKFKIGKTNVTYFAQDAFKNKANCSFTVTIEDNEPPTIEDCTDPPIFLSLDKNGANITWDEPNIFDNSQEVKIEKSHEFGYFKIGTTQVSYKAIDPSSNTNECVLNITIEETKCEDLPDPVYGNSQCAASSELKQCIITCQEGYAVPISTPLDTFDLDNYGSKFICNVSDPIWYSLEGQMFPDCTVTEIPKNILQEGSIVVEGINNTVICEDPVKLNALENEIENNLLHELSDSCNGISCKLNTSAKCEDTKDTEEEISNIIKRDILGKKVKKKSQKVTNVEFQLNAQLLQPSSKENSYLNFTNIMRSSLTNNQKYKIKLNKPKIICSNGFVQRKTKCVQCPMGTFHNLTTNVCESCTFGFYNDQLGQIKCKNCPIHFSTRRMKTKSSKDCIEQCPPGTFARKKIIKIKSKELKSIVRPTLKPYCRSCPIGFYQSDYGQLKCVPCPKGTTTSSRKSNYPSECHPTIEEICSDNKTNICNHGTCKIENKFYYTCICHDNYIGSHCEYKIDPCMSNPCLNDGFCQNTNNSFRCICSKGYTGTYCQEIEETCEPKCINNGICVQSTDDDKFCLCPKGFAGKYCEEKIRYCRSNLCENDGKCTEQYNSYKCVCHNGFIGRRCNLLPCDYTPCSGNKSCANLEITNANRKSFRCDCPSGYEGKQCNQKIEHCKSNPCLNNGACIENLTNYTCSCPKTYCGLNCESQMSGDYVLKFSKLSTTEYVKMNGSPQNLTQISVCFWIQTTDKFNYGTILSYATSNYDNALTITDYTGLVLYINNKHIVTNIFLNDGEWHYFCIGWENVNGNYTFYVDGKIVQSGQNFAKGEIIQGNGILVIGQEQDALGGEFSQSESFIGRLSYLDVWNEYFDETQMKILMESCDEIMYGNVYAWPEIKYYVNGDVEVENSTFCQLCDEPEYMYHGLVNVKNNIAYYTCNDGYIINTNAYTNGRKCTKSKKWEGNKEPECKPVYCGHPGHFNNGYIVEHKFYYLNKVTYKCYHGYNMTGNSTRYCSKYGKWLPEEPPLCLGNECAAIKIPQNSKITLLPDVPYEEYLEESTYFEATSQLQINCSDAYVLEGESILTCQENGTWNYDPPKCVLPKPEVKTCTIELMPPAPLNGYVDHESQLAFENGSNNYIEYKCRSGYILQGKNITICADDGSWTIPNITCKPIECPDPPKLKLMEIAERNMSLTYYSGNMVLLNCVNGYRMIGKNAIRCMANSKWSKMYGKCIKKSCRKPSVSENTQIQGNSYLFEDKVTLTCPSQKQYTLICNAFEEWIGHKDETC